MVRVVFLIQILLIYGGHCSHYFWAMWLKIYIIHWATDAIACTHVTLVGGKCLVTTSTTQCLLHSRNFQWNLQKNSENKPRGLYFVKGPFWGASFWRGLYSDGHVRREICVSKSIRLAYSSKEIFCFFFVLRIWGHCFQVQVPGGLIFGGAI